MAFRTFHAIHELEQAERLEFLRSCPPTSTYGQLALLPITIREWPEGFIIRLPLAPHLIVVPYERHGESWAAVVVGNPAPMYPVNCRLSLSHDEVIRGTRIKLENNNV